MRGVSLQQELAKVQPPNMSLMSLLVLLPHLARAAGKTDSLNHTPLAWRPSQSEESAEC